MSYKDYRLTAFSVGKILMILILLSFFITSNAYCKDIATFLGIKGQVFQLKDNKPPEKPAKIHGGAAEGDGIHTKVASRAHLRLIDVSDLFIAPNSEIILDYYFDDFVQGETLATMVTKGIVHYVNNSLSKIKSSELFIKTKHSMGGIRGTDFYILIGNNFTDYFVKSGRIVVTAILNKRAGDKSSELFVLEKQMEIRGGCGGVVGALKGAPIIGGDSQVGSLQAIRVYDGMPPSKVVNIPLNYFDRLDKLMITGIPDHFQEGKDPKELLELMGPL